VIEGRIGYPCTCCCAFGRLCAGRPNKIPMLYLIGMVVVVTVVIVVWQ
jgi:hypothetical protein